MTENSNHDHELLLMAYLDGELDAEDRARAEALISENPVYASQLEQWREDGNAIRSLPRYRLGDEFTGRVMKAIENTDSFSGFTKPKTPSAGVAKNENTNWRISLAAIATLAALLLVTLFVFPAIDAPQPFVSQLDVKEIAKEDFAQDKLAKSEFGAAKAAVATSDMAIEYDADEAVEGESFRAESFEDSAAAPEKDSAAAPETQKNETRGARNAGMNAAAADRSKSIANASESADVISSSQPATRSASRLGVEQVLWIETKSPTAIADIEKVLANNSIQLAAGNKDQAKFSRYRADNAKQAIFVISTASQMSNSIRELSEDSRNTVTAYPLPQNVDGLQPTENPLGSARQIAPFGLNKKKSDELEDSDDAEIAQVDKWFDLAGREDDSSPLRFLIFVTSSPVSEAASDE